MPKLGPDPDKKKHANSKHTLFYAGRGNQNAPHTCLSRSHFLKDPENSGRNQPRPHQLNFGSSQSIEVNETPTVVSPGLTPKDDKWWPTQFPKAKKLARVPKCVVLSSLPTWTAMWKKTSFFFPQDVIGRMFTSPYLFGNYYYFEQWDMDNGNQVSGITHQKIGDLDSPYYNLHPQLLDTFAEVKATLEADPIDPIYVVIPDWFPRQIQMKSQSDGWQLGQLNPAHVWNESLFDVTSCLIYPVSNTDITYPDVGDSRNYSEFAQYQGIPALFSGGQGFATKTLHIYVGHYAQRYGLDWSSAFTWESFPDFPEGQLIAGSYLGNYLGGPLPFYNGRRAVWRDLGFPYGYCDGLGNPNDLYNYYSAFVEREVGGYKDNFYAHSSWATKLYTYPNQWNVALQPSNIRNDRYPCTGLRFWFGYDTIADFNAAAGGPDLVFEDESGAYGGLKVAKGTSYQPSEADLSAAIGTFAPPIIKRVKNYYDTLDSGTGQFFQEMIDANGLADYGMSYEGDASAIMSAGALIDTIRKHFSKN